ncbi:hypothetical protein FNU76_03710 [Chitinimonas arctica]|uniref:PilZ domain-containing protein n=1 Tax=Chitinimonas arctica TaxID=2594795 RepID=A0A516SBK4_9NEIS|nr:hypothetical protein [Chitinimonas arctica]QDQ25531.1 hypothetical protein FNU76_03710 [Chitinimonas arctica]
MRRLFESLTGMVKRDTDPLSEPRTAMTWMREIKQEDISTQLSAVRDMVAKIEGRNSVNLATLQALFVIDEKIQPTYEQVRQQYIQNPRAGKAIEEKLWDDIVGFARAMLAAYEPFVRLEEPALGEEAGFIQSTALMLARAMHYVGIQVKWHYFRFQNPPATLWATANQLYRLAEVSGVDSQAFRLYPDQETQPTSCADEFIRIQMLSSLHNGNFSLRQFDWADRWLSIWSGNVQVERKYRDGVHQFCVNLAEPMGAVKINEAIEGDMLRFWGVGALLAEMGKLMNQLEAGDSPARLGLGDDARMPSCLEFLRQLEILWSRERSQDTNRSERTKVNKLVQITSGLATVFSAVRFDDERAMARASVRGTPDGDEVMDMKLYGYVTERTRQKLVQAQSRNHAYANKAKSIEHDEWVVENQSAGGFGAILPVEGHDWVRLGVLLAVRNDEQSSWMIAVIRRLNRINPEQIYAGVQILTNTPVAASMKSLDEERHVPVVGEGIDTVGLVLRKNALYIPYLGEGKRINTVLMHAADYAPGRLYHLVAREKAFMIRIGETLEKGPDWIWTSVELLRRDA